MSGLKVRLWDIQTSGTRRARRPNFSNAQQNIIFQVVQSLCSVSHQKLMSGSLACVNAQTRILLTVNPQDEILLTRVVDAVRYSPEILPLETWAELAEVAAWSTEFPALRHLENLRVDEKQVGAPYVRYHLYSLLLEQRAQLRQEHRISYGGSTVRVQWDLTEGGCVALVTIFLESVYTGTADPRYFARAHTGSKSNSCTPTKWCSSTTHW